MKPLALVWIALLLSPLLVCVDAATVAAAYDPWNDWAKVAWGYFQPGVGVSSHTGLHYTALGWYFFTDWDLGVYIKAITDAEKLGIVPRDGEWGADYRLEKVLSFLETRKLVDGVPYVQYDADTGTPSIYIGSQTAHPSDCANLLLALDDLRRFRPDLKPRIDSLVLVPSTRYNFQKLADDSYFAADDIYPSYVAQGYWAFGYSTPKLKPLESLGDGTFVDVYGESLPKARLTSEPFALAILEDRATSLYRTYADRVFSAQQKRYEETGTLTAFSEGMYYPPDNYAYEWVVNAQGEKFVVYSWNGKIILNSLPLAYTKIAFAFHAIYNNQYTSLLVNELSPLQASAPLGGFYEGKSEGRPPVGGAPLNTPGDKTNGMILAAARYHATHTTTTSASTETSTTSTTSASTGTTTTATSSNGTETTSTVSTVMTNVTTTTIVGLQIQVVSNSSVSSLIFDSTRGLLNFTVSGPTGSYGFFNATIAKSLISGQPIVMMDGAQTTAAVSDDANFWYIHVTYTHSQHHVTIGDSNTVPEFPPASLLAIVLMLTIVIFRRRHKN